MKNSKKIVNKDEILNYDSVFKRENSGKKKQSGFIGKVVKQNFWSILFSSIMYVIKNSPVYIIPIITAMVIDKVVAGNVQAIELIILGGIFLFSVVQNLPTHMLYAKINDRMLRNAGAGIRSTIVRKLQSLSLTYHKEMESGKLQSKFLHDTENVEIYLRLLATTVLPAILNLTINSAITIYQSPIVALFFVAVIPANVLLVKFYRKPIRKSNRKLREETEAVSTKLSQMLEMMQVTKAHGLENIEISDFEEELKKLKQCGLDADKKLAYFGSVAWMVSQLFSGLCLFFCAFMTIKGVPGFTVGNIVLYQSLFTQLNASIQVIITSYPQIASGNESIASISEIMQSDDIEQNAGKNSVKKVKGDITFENVYYKYPKNKEYVIKDFSLEVKSGECIAFVGSSGSGKTTIMNMIIGFLTPTKGNLYIDGQNIKNINLSDYRHSISVVPQTSFLFNGTIKQNITYGLSGYTDEQLNDVIKMANIEEFLVGLPDGLDSNIGEHGGKLSGGQKQRITIARALIRNPSILILDEATSALDNASEYHIQQAIEKGIQGRTTFVVAHRLSTIRNATRIVVIENGKVVEMGNYAELMEKQGAFFRLKKLNDIENKTNDDIIA